MTRIRRACLLLLLLALASCAPAVRVAAPAAPAPEARELVVLVHGLGRSSRSMAPLAWTLEGAGYEVLNWGYSSTCCTIPELGSRLRRAVEEHPGARSGRVHFVGHSLGNILIRHVLAREDLTITPGRVVMLAPPNQGSRAADRLTPLLGWLLEPLPELRTAAMGSAAGLAVPQSVDVGVIAGEHDGKVSVAETHLQGMDAHTVVPAFHSFIMLRSDVHRHVLHFLRQGAFDEAPAPSGAATPRPMQELQVCVLQDGRPRQVAAAYDPATGDTLYGGRRLREAIVDTAGYAAHLRWYVDNEPIILERRRYTKYGLPRVLEPSAVRPAGEHGGVVLFSEVDDADAPDVLWVPVRRGCIFHPYQWDLLTGGIRG